MLNNPGLRSKRRKLDTDNGGPSLSRPNRWDKSESSFSNPIGTGPTLDKSPVDPEYHRTLSPGSPKVLKLLEITGPYHQGPEYEGFGAYTPSDGDEAQILGSLSNYEGLSGCNFVSSSMVSAQIGSQAILGTKSLHQPSSYFANHSESSTVVVTSNRSVNLDSYGLSSVGTGALNLAKQTVLYGHVNGDASNPLGNRAGGIINDATYGSNEDELDKPKPLASLNSHRDEPLDNEEADPEGLVYPLYTHQKQALRWMIHMEKDKLKKGGILADDMGLGKTVSSLALILSRRPCSPPGERYSLVCISGNLRDHS